MFMTPKSERFWEAPDGEPYEPPSLPQAEKDWLIEMDEDFPDRHTRHARGLIDAEANDEPQYKE